MFKFLTISINNSNGELQASTTNVKSRFIGEFIRGGTTRLSGKRVDAPVAQSEGKSWLLVS